MQSNKTKLKFIKDIFNKKLDTLNFFVISKCNSRCIGCFNWKNLNKPNDLTLEEIKKISKSMPKFRHVLFSGGEPTLRQDLPEICEIFHKNNNISSIGIPSNGIITEQVIKIAKGIMEKNPSLEVGIYFSLDGLEKNHDLLRGIKGNFKKVTKSIKELNKLTKEFPQLDISANTVISNINYKEIPQLVEFVKKLKVSSHTFDLLRGEVKDRIKINLPPIKEIKKLNKIREEIKNYYTQKDPLPQKIFSRLKERYLLYTQMRVLNKKKLPFDCLGGKNIAVIYAEGDMALCEILPPIGNLRKENYNFKKLWKNQKAQNQREIIKNHKCDCTHFCFLSGSVDHSAKTIFLKMPFRYFFKK